MSKILPSLDEYIPHLAYDSVIFGFNGEELKILILEYHNTGLFALPGGFVRRNENLDDAVKRGLNERTGLDKIYLFKHKWILTRLKKGLVGTFIINFRMFTKNAG